MTEQEKLTSQWITSLAISVVCCAALFLIFAGYIIDLHDKTSLAMIRIDVLQERQNQLIAELDSLRRPIPVTMTNPLAPRTDPAASSQPAQQPALPLQPGALPDASNPTQATPVTKP